MVLSEIMNKPLCAIGLDETLRRAQDLFGMHEFHHLLVVEEGRVVGVVSDRDVLKHLSPFVGHRANEREQDRATLRRKIHQIMTRALICAPPHLDVHVAAWMLVDHGISCLPVVDAEMRPLGIVTWKDLLRYCVAEMTTEGSPPTEPAQGRS